MIHPRRGACYAAALAATVLALTGCSRGMSAAVESLRHVVQRGGEADSTPLDPKFAYLRVTRGNHVGLLWRGSVERNPAGPVEVYYSGTGEVVRLQNGRLVGALGLTTEWRRVEVAPPAWSAVAASRQSSRFVRVRDVMPGYRSGVRDELVLRVIAPPSRSALQRVDPATLTWFEESVERRGGFRLPGTPSDTLPTARYAVDLRGRQETVVYAEQCLAPDLCFTWQRWSGALQQASTPRAE